MITDDDLRHLGRCVDLAEQALDEGDEPFGSVLVGPDGGVLAEDRNRVKTKNDETEHPEFSLARWATRLPYVVRAAGRLAARPGGGCGAGPGAGHR